MITITRRTAIEVIEDAFTDLVTARGRGMALGVCGTFYLCGLISEKEWRRYLQRIPPEPFDALALAHPDLVDARPPGQARPAPAPGP